MTLIEVLQIFLHEYNYYSKCKWIDDPISLALQKTLPKVSKQLTEPQRIPRDEVMLLIKDELIEKLLRYGFSSVDMTVTEFVEDFFKKYL